MSSKLSTVLSLMPSKSVILISFILVTGGGAGYLYLGFEEPEFEIQDPADVENISTEETQFSTTLNVKNNANYPLPTDLAGGKYNVKLENTSLVEGDLEMPSLKQGNNTIQMNSTLDNKNIPDAWRSYLRDNETTELELKLTLTRLGPIQRQGLFSQSINRTVGEGKQPVQSALSSSVSGLEGEYSTTVSTESLTQGTPIPSVEEELGYQIRDSEMEVSEIKENETILHMKLDVYNPSRVLPVPAEPKTLGVTTEANNYTLIQAQNDNDILINKEDFKQGEVINSPVIPPQQEKTVIYKLELQNEKIDEWFVSHLRNEEYTRLESDFEFVFDYRGTEYRIPNDSPIGYNCDIQTNFFYENKTQDVSCEDEVDNPLSGNNTQEDNNQQQNNSDDESTQDEQDNTSESGDSPVVISDITPESGSAPLTVTLDGSESYDPDGQIEIYEWSVVGLDYTREGSMKEVDIPLPGEYQVKLTVTDDSGKTNSTVQTVVVE